MLGLGLGTLVYPGKRCETEELDHIFFEVGLDCQSVSFQMA